MKFKNSDFSPYDFKHKIIYAAAIIANVIVAPLSLHKNRYTLFINYIILFILVTLQLSNFKTCSE